MSEWQHAHVPRCSALRSDATWLDQMGIVAARLTSTACALAGAQVADQEAQAQRSVVISQASTQRHERMQQLHIAQADATLQWREPAANRCAWRGLDAQAGDAV